MPKQMTREERAAYMRKYRARKKGLPVDGEAEVRVHDPAPDIVKTPVDTSHPRDVSRETHAACDARIAELEDQVRAARARYDPLLAMLHTIYAQTAGQKDDYRAVVRMDTVRELRALCDAEAVF